jgi:hypothetical protein
MSGMITPAPLLASGIFREKSIHLKAVCQLIETSRVKTSPQSQGPRPDDKNGALRLGRLPTQTRARRGIERLFERSTGTMHGIA